MNMIRSTLLVCLTIMACVAMGILYHYHTDRYTITSTGKQAFILDRKNGVLTYCDGTDCTLLPFQQLVQAGALMGGGNAGNGAACAPGAVMPGVPGNLANAQSFHAVGQPLAISGLQVNTKVAKNKDADKDADKDEVNDDNNDDNNGDDKDSGDDGKQ